MNKLGNSPNTTKPCCKYCKFLASQTQIIIIFFLVADGVLLGITELKYSYMKKNLQINYNWEATKLTSKTLWEQEAAGDSLAIFLGRQLRAY